MCNTATGPAVGVRVTAVPEDGAANSAVCEAVARWLGVAKGAVTLSLGGKSRVKLLAIAGDPEDVSGRLRAALAAARDNTD